MSSSPGRITQKTVGVEGNGKQPHKIHFPRQGSEFYFYSFGTKLGAGESFVVQYCCVAYSISSIAETRDRALGFF